MYCDELFFLQTALDGVSDLSVAALAARVSALGARHQSPITFATKFGSGRPDGASVARGTAYDRACSCFRYTGATIAFD
jgi:hypothetical protein